MNPHVTLVGDGIENPANALTMSHAAEMFGVACRFRDTKRLASSAISLASGDVRFPIIAVPEIRAQHARIIAFDNLPGAVDVFGFRAGADFALLVGNERRGVSHEVATLATDRVHVPMASRRINCLNVAAASAVALYYLCGTPVGPIAVRRDPARRRPELLLAGADDHVELGSAIRSAAAFGWERLFIEDRRRVWFGCDRIVRSQGRAAARRGRNDILCIPCQPNSSHSFTNVTVITSKPIGIPIHRANLARGPGQIVVIPDEGCIDGSAQPWSCLGDTVEFAHLQIPVSEFTYHYRLIATIALAEVSRQVGRRLSIKPLREPRPPFYDHKLARLAEMSGETVRLDELADY